MRKCIRSTAAATLAAVVLHGCAAPRPVLYPNEALQKKGDAAAQRDIDQCMALAEQHVGSAASGKAADTAKSTGVGAAGGAAVGAVGGAITGNAGQGAAVGAATGATAGLLHGIFSQSGPDPVVQSFVDRCLRERGYEPIGWR